MAALCLDCRQGLGLACHRCCKLMARDVVWGASIEALERFEICDARCLGMLQQRLNLGKLGRAEFVSYFRSITAIFQRNTPLRSLTLQHTPSSSAPK